MYVQHYRLFMREDWLLLRRGDALSQRPTGAIRKAGEPVFESTARRMFLTGELYFGILLRAILVATVFAASTAEAQLSGRVVDQSERGVARATILFVDSLGVSSRVQTAEDGGFRVEKAGRAPFVIAIRALGYPPATITVATDTPSIVVKIGARSLAAVRQVAPRRNPPASTQRLDPPGARVVGRESASNLAVGRTEELLSLTPGFDVSDDGLSLPRDLRPVGLPPESVDFTFASLPSLIRSFPRSAATASRLAPGANSPLSPTAFGYIIDTDVPQGVLRQALLRSRLEVDAMSIALRNLKSSSLSLPLIAKDSSVLSISLEAESQRQSRSQSDAVRLSRFPAPNSAFSEYRDLEEAQAVRSSRLLASYQSIIARRTRTATLWINADDGIGAQAYGDGLGRDRSSSARNREWQLRLGQNSNITRTDTLSIQAVIGSTTRRDLLDGARGLTMTECNEPLACSADVSSLISSVKQSNNVERRLSAFRLSASHGFRKFVGSTAVGVGYERLGSELIRRTTSLLIPIADAQKQIDLLPATLLITRGGAGIETARLNGGVQGQLSPTPALKLGLSLGVPLWEQRAVSRGSFEVTARAAVKRLSVGGIALLQPTHPIGKIGFSQLTSIRLAASVVRGAEAQLPVTMTAALAGVSTIQTCATARVLPLDLSSHQGCASDLVTTKTLINPSIVTEEPTLYRVAVETRAAVANIGVRVSGSNVRAHGMLNHSPLPYATIIERQLTIGAREGTARVNQLQLSLESVSPGISTRSVQWTLAISGTHGQTNWAGYPGRPPEPISDLAAAGSITFAIGPGVFANVFANARSGRPFLPISGYDKNRNGVLDDPVDIRELELINLSLTGDTPAAACARRIMRGGSYCRGAAGTLLASSLSIPGNVLRMRGDSRVFVTLRGLENMVFGSRTADAFAISPNAKLTNADQSRLNPTFGRGIWSANLRRAPLINIDVVLPLGRRPTASVKQAAVSRARQGVITSNEIDALLERDALDLPSRLLRRADQIALSPSEIEAVVRLRHTFSAAMNQLNASIQRSSADPIAFEKNLQHAFQARWEIVIGIAKSAAGLRLAERGKLDANELFLLDVKRLTVLRNYYR